VPALAVWGLLRGRLRDYGISVAGMRKHVWIYVALYLAILPVVVIASYTKPFLHTYPFYKMAGRSWTDYVAWELMYGASFLALEFFFRGFLLFALKRTMGAYAIFVMIVPYCMIHFHKPVAEVCGAIFAGIVLGTLAMATRSIWCGVLIHVSVAWTMDALALWHTTGFPGSGRFIGDYY
jgi:membrane protease YdiL (CAAX protease family)